MLSGNRRSLGVGSSLALSAFMLSFPAQAAVYSYVSWTSADPALGTASGTITLPDDSTVDVELEALNQDLSAGRLYGAQVNGVGAANYWQPDKPYLSPEVENAPPTTDIIQLQGGENQTYRVTLSEPIKDPVMAIVSLGAASLSCSYDFDSPFTIVSQGTGYCGGTDTDLRALPGDILEGTEGHGTLRFIGTFSTFSWTVPTTERWHGFTFAIRTTEALEPTPVTGEAGAGSVASGGETSGGGADAASGAGVPGSGGVAADGGRPGEGGGKTDPSSIGGEAQGGEGAEPRAVTRGSGGCDCSLPGGSPSRGALAALLGSLLVARRRARRGS